MDVRRAAPGGRSEQMPQEVHALGAAGGALAALHQQPAVQREPTDARQVIAGKPHVRDRCFPPGAQVRTSAGGEENAESSTQTIVRRSLCGLRKARASAPWSSARSPLPHSSIQLSPRAAISSVLLGGGLSPRRPPFACYQRPERD